VPFNISTASAGLNVTNLDRAVDFYEAVFGFDVVRRGRVRGSAWVHLGTNHDVLLTLWEQCAVPASYAFAGLHHLSFEVDTFESLAAIEQRASASGAIMRSVASRPSPQALTGQVFFFDPDGIRLEVYTESDVPLRGAGEGPACGYYEHDLGETRDSLA